MALQFLVAASRREAPICTEQNRRDREHAGGRGGHWPALCRKYAGSGVSVDFGLGAGIAFYVWKLPPIHPWGGVWGAAFAFVILVWGAGMVAAGLFALVFVAAEAVYHWTLREIPRLSGRQRLVLTLAAAVAAVAIIAIAGTALGSAGGYVLPAIFGR
jgi:hypothetical protein